MSTTAIMIVVLVAIAAAVVAWYFLRERRSRDLRTRFGPEYDHVLRETGARSKAEDELLARQKRMEKIHVRSLSNEERDRFADEWQRTQAHFVDDPPGSIREADGLVCEVMKARGYPMSEFESRAEDLSVDYPHVVRNYRAGHAIAIRQEEGKASTEDLRQALVYYRDLFDELLGVHAVSGPRR